VFTHPNCDLSCRKALIGKSAELRILFVQPALMKLRRGIFSPLFLPPASRPALHYDGAIVVHRDFCKTLQISANCFEAERIDLKRNEAI
jgi:hypothetical protein